VRSCPRISLSRLEKIAAGPGRWKQYDFQK
jgi:hypothetical protein